MSWFLHVTLAPQYQHVELVVYKPLLTKPASFPRFSTMEGLMERLEQAVTRLEKLSITVRGSSSTANRDCVNGIDGGKLGSRTTRLRCWLTKETLNCISWYNILNFYVWVCPFVRRFVSEYGGFWCYPERSIVRLPEHQPSHRKRGGKTRKCTAQLWESRWQKRGVQ